MNFSFCIVQCKIVYRGALRNRSIKAFLEKNGQPALKLLYKASSHINVIIIHKIYNFASTVSRLSKYGIHPKQRVENSKTKKQMH